MSVVTETVSTTARTLADLVNELGNVPLERVLAAPPPGTATEQDLIRLGAAADKHLCELIDGVLVEKPVGFFESVLAAALLRRIGQFVYERNLGFVASESGAVRIIAGRVRMPDVAFYSRHRFPGGKVPREAIASIAPDLAVEVLSPSNTAKEMAQKRRDYFAAGVRLVWEIDPRAKSATAWASVESATSLAENDPLDGADILPGFSVRLADLLAELEDSATG